MVRSKFYCELVAKIWNNYEKSFNYRATFRAVTNGSEENKAFFKYTPAGTLELTCIQYDQFESGKEYYLDMSEASAEVH